MEANSVNAVASVQAASSVRSAPPPAPPAPVSGNEEVEPQTGNETQDGQGNRVNIVA